MGKTMLQKLNSNNNNTNNFCHKLEKKNVKTMLHILLFDENKNIPKSG